MGMNAQSDAGGQRAQLTLGLPIPSRLDKVFYSFHLIEIQNGLFSPFLLFCAVGSLVPFWDTTRLGTLVM